MSAQAAIPLAIHTNRNAAPAARRLVRVAWEATAKGINQVQPGEHLGTSASRSKRRAKKNGYSVVWDLCGHGTGQEMHEEPKVLNDGRPGTGLRLREGIVFTIEPMSNQGARKVSIASDGRTLVINDRKLSALFEHTVALTLRCDEMNTAAV